MAFFLVFILLFVFMELSDASDPHEKTIIIRENLKKQDEHIRQKYTHPLLDKPYGFRYVNGKLMLIRTDLINKER